ncbi:MULTISPECIES: sensor histidine kinase [Bacillus]|uniref:histidine kinase n=2 Tax=Bacillus wiedmannii TaxID=1890302 RepID=A0A2B6KU31_9BACI|nr:MULTISPECIES: HAMP domain-containing sensor histidine kinase [Bacillus]MDF9662241.1 HAMP domain-containing sensor histidine kinase [Bacillus wiedmannii]MDI6507602.1 HAMP domain-containing sensor histidine kinase [Bacillus wiedmannii]MDI6513295.1 HAMP domain-containing sensor histidine kinase [Bacillus wiedmannii]PFZ26170.1 two-component sensor histidine kinase [Bacillus wiedmannii]PGC20041.1 two-component sensor histidine kinase [Bacillus wiedmannii]
MNKLGKKLFLSISLTVILIFTISLLLINYLLPKYNIYKTRESLEGITAQIQSIPSKQLDEAITSIENKGNVTIAYTSINNSEDQINDELRMQLTRKRVALNKLWITKEEVMKVKNFGQANKIYDQEKIKSSFFVKYIAKDDMLILVGVSIAHSNEVIKTLNSFYFYIFGITIFLIIVLVWILSTTITRPLKELSNVAEDISNLKFERAKVKTNDEIGDLANSINIMSEKLNEAHEDLTDRNEHLKRFMGDVTHELKTPIALVKAYSMGIKDGLDDGTYIDTIIKQTDHISNLIEELLRFSKLERDVLEREEFDIKSLVQSILDKHKIELESKEINLQVNYNVSDAVVNADVNKMKMVFQNLISNAIKYTANQNIKITLEDRHKNIYFQIQNGMNAEQMKDIDKIWEPFYVLESSRSKDHSGTGLGLAIVKSILERHGFDYGVSTIEGDIRFYINMKND